MVKTDSFIFIVTFSNNTMATIQQLQDLKKTLNKQLDKLIESLPKPADAVDEDSEPEKEKLTPIQKLEKRLEAANEKLEALTSKKVTAKTNVEKDAENKAKLETTISEIQAKLSELQEKPAAKPAAKKAAKVAEVEAKPETKVEAKPETKVEAKAKTDKNIPRVTPAMTTQLKAEFESAGNEWDDKYKKEFFDQMNSMDATTYASQGLESRMTAFAESKSPAAGGGNIQSLTVTELHNQNKNLTEVSAGIYQHKTTGKQVTGPSEDADEELDDATIDDVEYVVGQKTKRVYLSETEEFVGYMGVGKFYEADL